MTIFYPHEDLLLIIGPELYSVGLTVSTSRLECCPTNKRNLLHPLCTIDDALDPLIGLARAEALILQPPVRVIGVPISLPRVADE